MLCCGTLPARVPGNQQRFMFLTFAPRLQPFLTAEFVASNVWSMLLFVGGLSVGDPVLLLPALCIT
jgi:hypothetical protein